MQPLPGPRLELNGDWSVQTVAPDRSIAVLSDNAAGDLAIVDLVRMRDLGRVRLPVIGLHVGWVAGSNFIGRSRLLLARAASDESSSTVEATLVDLATRRVLHQRRLDGRLLASARLPGGLALLLAPSTSIGPARLALVSADTRVRIATLDKVAAGFQRLGTDQSDPRSRQAVPGLAVDPAGRRALVIAAGAPAAEVDVTSLAIAYHRLGRPTSALQRLASGRLLAWGASFGPDGNQRYGLTVFGPGERRPVHLLGSKQVTRVQVSGNLAYASLIEGNANAYDVTDLRSNRVLRHAQGDLPQLILPGQR